MRFQLVTTADPETAFARVSDFAELETWDPFVRRSILESGEALKVGGLYRLESPVGLTLRYRVVDLEVPRFVIYQGGTDRVRTTDTIEVAAVSEGSKVTVSSEMRFEGRMKLFAPLIRTLVWLGGRFVSLPALRRHLAGNG